MESITAESRTIQGKAVSSLREKGLLPAVIYGKGQKTEMISVPFVDFIKLWRHAGESTVVSLKMSGGDKSVLIHDVSFDPLKGMPTHADFYVVDMKRKVRVEVPIEWKGEEDAAKAGILVKVLHALHVEALPSDLPHAISVDVSVLKSPADTVLVENILLPKGVVILNEKDELVALVEAPKETVEETTEAFSEDAVKNIEVVEKGKKAEEGDEAATE
jgi:large subunit ribosomal protein L25